MNLALIVLIVYIVCVCKQLGLLLVYQSLALIRVIREKFFVKILYYYNQFVNKTLYTKHLNSIIIYQRSYSIKIKIT